MSAQRIITIQIQDPQRRLVYAMYLRPSIEYKTRLPAGNHSYQIFEGDKQVQAGTITVAPDVPPTIRVQG